MAGMEMQTFVKLIAQFLDAGM